MSARIRPAIETLPDYDPRDLSDDGIAIRLHRNEGALPPPEFVLEAIRGIDAETLRTYPTALQREVTARLAARFARDEVDLVLYLPRAAWPHLKVSHGVIVNMASLNATLSFKNLGSLAHTTR